MTARYRTGRAAAVAALALTAAALAVPVPAAAAATPTTVAATEAEPPSPSPGPPPEPPPEEPTEPAPEPEPSPEPSPSPGPEPTPPPADDGGEAPDEPAQGEECGMFDYACKVQQAFIGWLASMVADAVNAKLAAVWVEYLHTPEPTPGVESSWSMARVVANALYVLAVTAAGVLVMTHHSVQTSTGLKEVLPRLLLGFVGANASWFLCTMMADFGNAVSLFLLGEAASPEAVAKSIERLLNDPAEIGTLLVLAVIAVIMQWVLAFAAIVRIMLWLLLSAAAPLALAAHALPQTEGLARLWWRAIGALLLIQVAQAFVLRMAVTIFLSRDGILVVGDGGIGAAYLDLMMVIACLYVLVRIPFWAFKRVFNYQNSPLVKAAKFAVHVLVLRNIGKAMASAKAAKPAAGWPGRGAASGAGPPRGPRPAGPRPASSPSGSPGGAHAGARSGGSAGASSSGGRHQAPPRGSGGSSGGAAPTGGRSSSTSGPPAGGGRSSSTRGSQQPGQAGAGSGAAPRGGAGQRGGRGRGGAPGSAAPGAAPHFAGTPRHFPGGVSQHRPPPPGPHDPPPDPTRYRPMRPKNIRLRPPHQQRSDSPPRGGPGSRPVRPRPHHYRRRPRGGS
ncbi:hypothetical protein CLV63_12463 [Murinocardiopsis flavida]|uniref:TrbL/VirB6 plasmid conjugal transfer protein n=1 Tax=Murinocardiopsis flavida TaxID=645275 RepID=A0A2P8CYC1_9ACTN|nr:hypothetical protein [Murinocardiopsis flavida]PSK89959.1 hypothetical protein CLV63_12463 [Murinocardiopsis flavida]